VRADVDDSPLFVAPLDFALHGSLPANGLKRPLDFEQPVELYGLRVVFAFLFYDLDRRAELILADQTGDGGYEISIIGQGRVNSSQESGDITFTERCRHSTEEIDELLVCIGQKDGRRAHE